MAAIQLVILQLEFVVVSPGKWLLTLWEVTKLGQLLPKLSQRPWTKIPDRKQLILIGGKDLTHTLDLPAAERVQDSRRETQVNQRLVDNFLRDLQSRTGSFLAVAGGKGGEDLRLTHQDPSGLCQRIIRFYRA